MNGKKLLGPALALIAFGLGLALFHRTQPPAAQAAPAAAAPVAALYGAALPDAQGRQQALAQWRGKTVLVNFWATWCPPCVQEMPELAALEKEFAGRVHVIGIGIDNPSSIAAFAHKHGIAYPLYVAGMAGTELSKTLGNRNGGLPFTVLVGADGTIRRTYLGRLDFKTLRADLQGL